MNVRVACKSKFDVPQFQEEVTRILFFAVIFFNFLYCLSASQEETQEKERVKLNEFGLQLHIRKSICLTFVLPLICKLFGSGCAAYRRGAHAFRSS